MGNEKGLQERLIRRAWEDEQFAALLRTNPHEAIAKETGIEVPATVKIQVHQEDGSTFHLVVPAKPRDHRAVQLSGEETAYLVCRTNHTCMISGCTVGMSCE